MPNVFDKLATTKDGLVYIESSAKFRTPREVLVDGEPSRLRVSANQARPVRVGEIRAALAIAVEKGDFGLIDRSRALFDSYAGSEVAIGKLLDEAEKLVAPKRPKPEAPTS